MTLHDVLSSSTVINSVKFAKTEMHVHIREILSESLISQNI